MDPARLDSGTLAERLIALAHAAAYHRDITPAELRDLANHANELARRLEHARAHDDD